MSTRPRAHVNLHAHEIHSPPSLRQNNPSNILNMRHNGHKTHKEKQKKKAKLVKRSSKSIDNIQRLDIFLWFSENPKNDMPGNDRARFLYPQFEQLFSHD